MTKAREVFTVLIAVLCLQFVLTACGSESVDTNQPEINTKCVHQYDLWSISKEATCAGEGMQIRTCQKCGYSETQTIAALPHTEIVDAAIEATCTADGKTEGKHCSVCNAIIVEQKKIPAAHKYDNGETIDAATCQKEGSKKYTCSVCEHTYTETVAKISHKYDNGTTTKQPTCETAGEQIFKCLVCNNEKVVSINKLGHSKNKDNICTRCGKQLPVELNMTTSEIETAKKVEYIGDREFYDEKDDKRYRIMFSLKDSSKNYLAVPVIVEIEIKNDNGESVYKSVRTVRTSDFSEWSNNYGKKWTATAVYINYSDIKGGTIKSGKLEYEVYNDYCSFSKTTETIYDNLPLKPTTINLPMLPVVIHDYTYKKTIDSSVRITNITYEVKDDDLYFYFTGEKTYDAKGTSYSQSCKVGWKLYDSDGYIVDSDTFYSPQIAVGEKFRNEKESAWGVIKPGETYTLVLSSID